MSLQCAGNLNNWSLTYNQWESTMLRERESKSERERAITVLSVVFFWVIFESLALSCALSGWSDLIDCMRCRAWSFKKMEEIHTWGCRGEKCLCHSFRIWMTVKVIYILHQVILSSDDTIEIFRGSTYLHFLFFQEVLLKVKILEIL